MQNSTNARLHASQSGPHISSTSSGTAKMRLSVSRFGRLDNMGSI